MGILKNNMLSYDGFCTELEQLSFNYKKIDEVEKLEMYDELLDTAENVDGDYEKIFKKIGITKEKINEVYKNKILNKDSILEGTHIFIKNLLKHTSINKEGYCLRINVLNHAVQMRNNKDMLGFITAFVEGSSRFIMVDFGEAEGAVKIDVDELIIG